MAVQQRQRHEMHVGWRGNHINRQPRVATEGPHRAGHPAPVDPAEHSGPRHSEHRAYHRIGLGLSLSIISACRPAPAGSATPAA